MSQRLFEGSLRTIVLVTSRLLGLFFLGWAAFYLLTALCAISNFAWRQPMFDQWRMYASFLTLPFPENILHLENGHRPIIPNLIRSAEVHYFTANQLLQITVGTACAFLTTSLIAFSIWREYELPTIARAAGVMLAVLGVFWFANARMLLHGNESVQTYLVTLSVASAGLCTWQARQRNALCWLIIACGVCSVATFSFGSGIASFPSIIVLGVLMRLPWRWQLLPLGTLVVCLILYLFVLPGDQGVRGMLDLHPFESTQIAAQWLSSPWANAWLGLADPPSQTSLPTNLHNIALGNMLIGSANALTSFTGVTWQSLTTLLGLSGIVVFIVRMAAFCLRRTELTRSQALSVTLCLFALATAVVIGIGRLDYLRANPDQIYADRYLMWPSLFWMGMALLLLIDASHADNRTFAKFGLLFLTAFPAIMLPTHRAGIGWGAAVFQRAQQNAAAIRSGVIEPTLLPNNPDATYTSRIRTLEALRFQHLAMFSDTAWERVGKRWTGATEHSNDFAVTSHIVGRVADVDNDESALHFEGCVEHGIVRLRRNGQLAVLDDTGVVAGLAEFSFIAPGADSLRLSIPQKRGFDGYIKRYDANRRYTLVSLDFEHDRAIALTPLISPQNSTTN